MIKELKLSIVKQLVGQGLKIVFALFLGSYIARYLGPSLLGKLSYVSAFVTVISPVGLLGLKGSLNYILCETKNKKRATSDAFLLQIIATALTFAVLILFVWGYNETQVNFLFVIVASGFLLNTLDLFDSYFFSIGSGSIVAKIDFIKTISGTFYTITLLVFKLNWILFGGVILFQNLSKLVYLFWIEKVSLYFKLSGEWKQEFRLLIRNGLPFIFSGISTILYSKMDILMLEWLDGYKQVGIYSVATKVIDSFYFIPVVMSRTFLPYLKSSDILSNKNTTFLYKVLWLSGFVLMLLNCLIVPELIVPIFGNAYLNSKVVLMVLSPTIFAVCLHTGSGSWLTANGKTDFIAQRSLVGIAFNLILNLILIPAYGVSGAAIATSISWFLSFIIIGIFQSEIRSNTKLILFPFTFF